MYIYFKGRTYGRAVELDCSGVTVKVLGESLFTVYVQPGQQEELQLDGCL